MATERSSPAIDREAGVEVTIDDLDRIHRQVPEEITATGARSVSFDELVSESD